MFHRVKSEVQDEEPKAQEQEEKRYRKDETEESSRDSERRERVYARGQSTQREEERPSMRTKESSSPVQGKYAPREEEEDKEESPRSGSYKPSVARGGYAGGGYTPSSGSTYTPPEAPSYAGNDRTLTIGRGINMSGEIDSCDHLMVEGTVEAALKGAKLLEIAETGTFYGTVEIEEATIAGRFEGDITVSGRLTVKSSGVITGSIAYRDLEIETGAVVDGRMTPLKAAIDEKAVDKYRAGSGASAMAKTKDASSSKKDAANSEAGLFSKAHASY